MAKKSTEEPQKPGPDPERLKIEGDPGEALDRLLHASEPATETFRCPVCDRESPLIGATFQRDDRPELVYICPNPKCDFQETDRERLFGLMAEKRHKSR